MELGRHSCLCRSRCRCSTQYLLCDLMKHWERALTDLRVRAPDIEGVRRDVKFLWEYIEDLEKKLEETEQMYEVPAEQQAVTEAYILERIPGN